MPDVKRLCIGAGIVPLRHPFAVGVEAAVVQAVLKPVKVCVKARVIAGGADRPAKIVGHIDEITPRGKRIILEIIPHAAGGVRPLEQAQQMLDLAFRHLHACGVGIQINAVGHAGFAAFFKVGLILRIVLMREVVAETRAQDDKFDARRLEGGKINVTVCVRKVDAKSFSHENPPSAGAGVCPLPKPAA